MIDIDKEHPDYTTRKYTWQAYRDLYTGGQEFQAHADRYLIQRQREPRDVYAERLRRVFYENYVGSIVDWYASTLFRTEPQMSYGDGGKAAEGFFAGFAGDCDRKGTNLTDFFRRQFVEGMIAGKSYILVDFPRLEDRPANRAEEDAVGASRAYLVGFRADEVINWSADEAGNLEWAVVRTQAKRRPSLDSADWFNETTWTYYDRTNYRRFVRRDFGTGSGAITEVAAGQHALSRVGQVPLIPLRLPEGLWMLNRSASLQLEHFNKTNALSWALTMGLFAMPVIYSDREWTQMIGESYYVQLSPGDRFGWTEPDGKVFQIAADNLRTLQEEIYRVCYLAPAGGALDPHGAQSGSSKQWQFAITYEVLRAFGDVMKDQIRRVLKAVEAAREDGDGVSVTGLDEFDIADFTTDIENAQALLGLGIQSETLKREIYKKLALKYVCDARQDVKDRIAAEIERTGALN